MTREEAKQRIVEELERQTGLSAHQVVDQDEHTHVVLGFPMILNYHYAWTGERFRLCCAGLVEPKALTYIGVEAARKATAAGKVGE